mmetsp:Transcript_95139/g.186692  ORF Transcript_95139/g.186692 Transcript_95139/m.186692 type:complete len:258 (+) Transcript_95139:62-835(+)
MSAIVEAQTDKTTSRRSRRRPSGGRRRGPRAEKTEGGEAAAPREKKERPESTPVPPSFVGQTKVGVVSAIIRKGRVKFGFINICPGPEIDEAAPRIYFNFTQMADSAVTIRRGYIVSFKVAADESSRAFAENIALTEEGKKIAAAKDAEIAARQAAKPAEEGEKPKRAPRERKPQPEKPVNVKVTCEGKSETKDITINAAQSVGKLKNVASTAFDAPMEFNVFHVTSAGNVFMTKAILTSLVDGDKIHLGKAVDATA